MQVIQEHEWGTNKDWLNFMPELVHAEYTLHNGQVNIYTNFDDVLLHNMRLYDVALSEPFGEKFFSMLVPVEKYNRAVKEAIRLGYGCPKLTNFPKYSYSELYDSRRARVEKYTSDHKIPTPWVSITDNPVHAIHTCGYKIVKHYDTCNGTITLYPVEGSSPVTLTGDNITKLFHIEVSENFTLTQCARWAYENYRDIKEK